MEVTGGSVRGIFTEEGLESRGGLLLNIENSDIPLDIQNNTGGQIPTGMVMFGDYITGIDIDITGNGEAINARTNGGLYSITAYGGSLGSIYAENDIVTASNIEAVDGDFSGDIDVTGSITQEGELLWVKRGGDEDSYLRLTETDSYRGCYVSYDGLGNKMQLGTHDVVDELTANDVPFMEVARGSVDVDFLGDLDVTGSVTADSAHVAYGSLDTFGVGYLTLFNSESDGVNNLSRTYISSTDGPNNGNGSYSAWSSVGDTTFSGWIRNYLGTDVDSKFMIVGSGNAEVFSVDYFGNSDFLGDLDVTGSVITGSFASAPSSPTAGQIYFNTTTNKHQGYDGTTWNNLY